ncbi:MCE family protein [Rhodococcus sp. NPDC058514]|uniref:MCE family protein n=1 Tax=unclassified Rhodococcus (in: high G+C Gram-positive bacteria) TaxID=192944 RepID=UPI0036472606
MRTRLAIKAATACAAIAVLAVVSYTLVPVAGKITVSADFRSTRGLYAGDDVRVMGVKVGSVRSIEPAGNHSVVRFTVDESRTIPADAKAVIVSQSLVSARYVQVAPAYTGGDVLLDGAHIPVERTAVPVEWDEIKEQLGRVAQSLGPTGGRPGPLSEVLGTAATALDGNGQTLHDTLRSLSDTMATLSDGRGDLFATVRGLQQFVSALSASGEQIVQFNGRMETIARVLGDNGDRLEAALGDLDIAAADVERFVRDNRDGLRDSLTALSDTASTLAERRDGIEQILHVSPTALANLQNIYQPAQNAATSALAMSNFANPVNFICSAIAGSAQVGAEEGANMCVDRLGPLLRLLTVDHPPLKSNPVHGVGALPNQLEYTEPDLRPAPVASPPVAASVPRVAGAPPVLVPPGLGLPGLLLPGGR